MRIGKWVIEPTRNKIVSDKKEVSLEPRVMEALVMMVSASPETVTTDEMIEALWPGSVAESSAVHRVINKLRHALEDTPKNPAYIETVPKRGYRILPSCLDVNAEETEEDLRETPVAMAPEEDEIIPVRKPKSVLFRLTGFGLVFIAGLSIAAVYWSELESPQATDETPEIDREEGTPEVAIALSSVLTY